MYSVINNFAYVLNKIFQLVYNYFYILYWWIIKWAQIIYLIKTTLVYWLYNDTPRLTWLVCHMLWNHFFPWIFLSCFLLVQSFRNPEFSPSDRFFAFELDLKNGYWLWKVQDAPQISDTDSLEFEYLYWIILQLIIIEEGEHLSCSLSQCIYFGETWSHRQG